MIDKAIEIIERQLSISKGVLDHGEYSREATDKFLCSCKASPNYFFKVLGESLLIGSVTTYPFSYNKVTTVVKLIGGDGNARKLMKEFIQWSEKKQAKHIEFGDLYKHDERIKPYMERLGFSFVGMTFIRKV